MNQRVAAALRTDVTAPDGTPREAVVLRVADDAGDMGWGEASPLPGYSPDNLDDVERALDDWAARWVREPFGESGASVDAAIDAVPTDLPSARCAVDGALLDFEARRLGVPLHARLMDFARPARTVERLPVAALISLAGVSRPGAPSPPADVVREVGDRVAEGYKTIKFKLGEADDFAAQIEQLAAVRMAFPYLRIRLDPNGAWAPEQARGHLAQLHRQIDPELVEQPVGARELLGFGRVPVPLAADESLRLPGALEQLAGPGGCTAIVLKPMVLGGLLACLRLAEEAFRQELRVIVSHTFGGPIAHAAACELALALAAVDPAARPLAAGLAGHDELEQRSGPWIQPAGTPGHGVEASW